MCEGIEDFVDEVVPRISSTLRGFRRFFGGSASTSVTSPGPAPNSSMENNSVSGFSRTIPLFCQSCL